MMRGTVEAGPAGARFRARGIAIAGVLLFCATGPATASPAHAATAAELDDRDFTRIIVKREPNLSAAQRADVRADAEVVLDRRLALPDTEVVRAAPGELAEALRRLAADPDVVYAEPDALVHAAGNDSHWSDLWALENLGQTVAGVAGVADADVDAPEAWLRATGKGETIAVVDSGVALKHPDLVGRLAVNAGEAGTRATNGRDDDGNGFVDDHRGWDWVGAANAPDDEDNSPADTNGHGTHVAGIIAATRDNRAGVAGVAPEAAVFPLRVLDANGSGYLSDAAEALYYAGANGYRVVNASLGLTVGPGDTGTMTAVRSLQNAIAAHPQTLYVLAAGNAGADNDATPFYPCSLPQPNIVCVGATDSSDRGAAFSNYGRAAVDLHAPGVAMRSTYLSGYEFMEGTSMAAPLVAGVAALVRQTDRRLAPAAVKERLLAGVEPRDSLSGRSVTGGRLNAAAAVGPTPTLAPSLEPVPDEQVDSAPAPSPSPVTAPVSEPAPSARPAPVSDPAPEPVSTPVVPAPRIRSAPALGAIRLSARTLKRSLAITVNLDRGATLRVSISRKACRAGHCRFQTVRDLTAPGRAGSNRLVLRRSGEGGRLLAGSHRLTVQARDGALKSASRSATFTVR